MQLTALTPVEKARFGDFMVAVETGDMALVRSSLDGNEVAVIVHIAVVLDAEGQDFILTPMAILLDDELTGRLIDPSTSLTE